MFVCVILVKKQFQILLLPKKQGAIKYGRLAAFLPGDPDLPTKFIPTLSNKPIFWPILPNNYLEQIRKYSFLIQRHQYFTGIFNSWFALSGSRKNYSALPKSIWVGTRIASNGSKRMLQNSGKCNNQKSLWL